MPMYEYTCLNCGQRFELLRTSGERDDMSECPQCGEEKKHLRVPSIFSGLSLDGGGGCTPSFGGFG